MTSTTPMPVAANKPRRLWLTYAWSDNQDQDVDYVIGELRAQGIEVHFDRAQLLAGTRLWQQIDQGITDPDRSDAWAIYVTKNSLKSEPCQEEIAYALDRCLRTRGGDFPLIGIFPESLDRSIIPSAIATRLYVTLRDNDWARAVSDGIGQSQRAFKLPDVSPFVLRTHRVKDEYVLEVHPRAGEWHSAVILVPETEADKLRCLWPGRKGRPRSDGMKESGSATGESRGIKFVGEGLFDAVDTQHSAYAWFTSPPTVVLIGADKDTYRVDNPFKI